MDFNSILQLHFSCAYPAGGAGADTFFLGNATTEDSDIVNGDEGLDWANLGLSLAGDVSNLLFTAVPVLQPFTIAKAVVPMLFDVLKATSNADDDYVEASVSGKGSATITDFDPTEDVVFIPLESVGSTIYLEEDSENGNLLQVFRDTGSTDLIATIQLSSEFDSLLGNDNFNTIENSWGQLLASNSLIMDSSGANFYGQTNLAIDQSDLENLGTNEFLVLGAYSGANYVGTTAGDYIYGTDFGDVLSGYENPSMYNTSGNDIIYGFDGDDEFLPGDGNDHIYGGEGSDTANYFNSTNGITINLSNQNLNDDGLGGKDILDSIENIIGSEYDDQITGDSSNNTLIGNGGDDVLNGENGLDTFEGGSGNDTLNGGLGTDTATYTNSTSGITINNLAKWYGLVENDGLGGTDKLYDVENIIGSDYDDYIRKDNSDSSNSILKGGKGDDSFYDSAGSDYLDGGDDNDYLFMGRDWYSQRYSYRRKR